MKATFRRQIAVLGLVAFAATGCSTAHTGRVAGRLGDQSVDTSVVTSYVNDVIGEQKGAPFSDADKLAAERKILGFLMQHQVFTALAAKEGVTATQADIDNQLASLGGAETVATSLVKANLPQSLLPTLLNSLVLQDHLVDKWVTISDADLQAAYQQQLPSLQTANFSFFAAADQAQADKIAAKVRAAPGTLEAAAKEVAGPTAAIAETGQKTHAQLTGDIGAKLWAAKVGDVLTLESAGKWVVVVVTEHNDKSFADARPALVAAVRKEQTAAAVTTHVSQLLATDPIEINPRFGTWDETKLTVVGADSETVVRGGRDSVTGSDLLGSGGVSDGSTPHGSTPTDGSTPADGAPPADGSTDPAPDQGSQPSP